MYPNIIHKHALNAHRTQRCHDNDKRKKKGEASLLTITDYNNKITRMPKWSSPAFPSAYKHVAVSVCYALWFVGAARARVSMYKCMLLVCPSIQSNETILFFFFCYLFHALSGYRSALYLFATIQIHLESSSKRNDLNYNNEISWISFANEHRRFIFRIRPIHKVQCRISIRKNLKFKRSTTLLFVLFLWKIIEKGKLHTLIQ